MTAGRSVLLLSRERRTPDLPDARRQTSGYCTSELGRPHLRKMESEKDSDRAQLAEEFGGGGAKVAKGRNVGVGIGVEAVERAAVQRGRQS